MIGVNIIIILLLILCNGVLSMSEMALVSVKRSKLEADLKKGGKYEKRAEALLKMKEDPDKFLSMIQIGITLIGIISGLFSGDALGDPLAIWFVNMGMNSGFAIALAKILIVLIVTYLTIVLGELVPKIVGINRAEKVSGIMYQPIKVLSWLVSPVIWLLSVSTKLVVKILGVQEDDEKVTEEEIMSVLNEGYDDGEVNEIERDIVEGAFDLDDINVTAVMTHRSDYEWLDINHSQQELLEQINQTMRSVYPVCSHSSDNILGVLYLKDCPLLKTEETFDIRKSLHECNYVPESMSLYKALENFKKLNTEYSIVIDEYGAVQGIVTLHDIVEVLVGEVIVDEAEEVKVVHRDDNSLLVDGQLSFFEFLDELDIDMDTDDLPYQTVAGLVLDILEHIPTEGEKVEWMNYTIEVVDMDKTRIDKLLVTKHPEEDEEDKDKEKNKDKD